jgi:hypothetical protein
MDAHFPVLTVRTSECIGIRVAIQSDGKEAHCRWISSGLWAGKPWSERKHSMDPLLYGTPSIESLEDLQDKMSVHRQGYSFVTEPANKLERSYLDLSTKACLHPVDGLMSSDVWKIDAVHRYLREETSLLRNIMLMMYLRGGQAPRTTEFLSIECCNGPSTLRGTCVHSGSIIYITRHSKARRMTNQEF